MHTVRLFLISMLLTACAHAQNNGILRGDNLKSISLEQSIQDIHPGSVVIIGENHGLKAHQKQQMEILTALRNKGLKVSVGLEFFSYPDQHLVNDYRNGHLLESEFLKLIKWGGTPYEFYRDQVFFPDLHENAATLALNAPRSLTSKIAKNGLPSLSPVDLALLPPQFSLGRESYHRRFLEAIPHLPSPEAADRYFAAQSVWDDTMAWKATDFMRSNPEHVLVIVVGDGHVQYGGGLPDRVRARYPGISVWTYSQINTLGLDEKEISKEIEPSPIYGLRSDFLWLEQGESPGL